MAGIRKREEEEKKKKKIKPSEAVTCVQLAHAQQMSLVLIGFI